MANLGRAAIVAADRKGFDLCDDTEGLDAGREMHDKHNRHLMMIDRNLGRSKQPANGSTL